MHQSEDQRYLDIFLKPIRTSANYRPKLGQGGTTGISLEEFQAIYQSDQFYNWLGLDNPLMYAAHKAAGGMTSIYRQIGIGGERLFRRILRDQLGLSSEDASWSYRVPIPGSLNKTRKLSLDGRIPLDKVSDKAAEKRVRDWMLMMADSLGVVEPVAQSLTGTVFEVRQGYKSKDSKRQNADLANAATAYTKSYFPCIIVLSSQIDTDIVQRYQTAHWGMLRGIARSNDPLVSTYAFINDVVGYDLVSFFERNSATLKSEVDKVLKSLLTAD